MSFVVTVVIVVVVHAFSKQTKMCPNECLW